MNEKHDKEQVWRDVLASLRVSVSSAIFTTWLSQTHLISLRKVDKKRYIAEIGCVSSFVKTTVESRYFGLTQDALMKTVGHPCDLVFSVKSKPVGESSEKIVSPLFEQTPNEDVLIEKIAKANLTPGFTFDTFAVSGSNQMAHAAAEAVSQEPGAAYNPLFIWGGVGVGKSHLMHAVGQRALQVNINSMVLACTGEDFTNDIVEGIRHKTTQAFRKKYRRLDMLLIDDIQFIAGKDTVMEEFFHTFNTVTRAGGQVILTADKPPGEIAKLEERLLSRFEAGLVVDIGQPDFELRCAIVEIKARQFKIELTTEHVHLIAGNVDGARKIEGVIKKIMSESKIKSKTIDEDLITSMIGSTGENTGFIDRKVTAEDFITAVCEHFSVGKRSIMGKSRTKTIVFPRQMLMYILRTELNLAYEEVGRLLGGRDHTTVMHGVEKITHLASKEDGVRGDIRRIRGAV